MAEKFVPADETTTESSDSDSFLVPQLKKRKSDYDEQTASTSSGCVGSATNAIPYNEFAECSVSKESSEGSISKEDSESIVSRVDSETVISIEDSDTTASKETIDSVSKEDAGTIVKKVNFGPSRGDSVTWNKFFELKDRISKESNYNKDLFALYLHTINTRAYRLLYKSCHLPTEKELKNVELNIGPLFNDLMTTLLNQKFDTLPKEARYCTLGLYTMALTPNFFYDYVNDDIIGFRDVNGEKTKHAATYVLVAMVRGINVKWCQPVSYAFLSTMSDLDGMNNFITTVLEKLMFMRIVVLAIVVPDETWFEAFYKSNKLDENVNVIYDLPHVLNRMRDEFMIYDFVFKRETVAWWCVKEVYNMVKKKGWCMLAKLTDKHFKPDTNDKSLQYPCQIFSKSVATAMSFLIERRGMPGLARPTVEFIHKVNAIFDVLNIAKMQPQMRGNSEKKESNKTQLKRSVKAQHKAIEHGFNLFTNQTTIRSGVDENPKSVEYFQVSFGSLMTVAAKLINAEQVGIMYTRHTYLEALLEFLKVIENDANSKTPTPSQFAKAFKKLFVKYLIEFKPPPRPTSIGKLAEFLKKVDGIQEQLPSEDKEQIKDTDYTLVIPNLYASLYLSSFLIFKCSEQHTCAVFKKYLEGLDNLNNSSMNIFFEDFNQEATFYNKLKFPTDEFVAYIERLDDCFIDNSDLIHGVHPVKKLRDALRHVPKCEDAHWPCNCFPDDYLLRLFLQVRIQQIITYNNPFVEESVLSPGVYELMMEKL